MDILRRRGKRGYEAFLEALEFYYPEHYTRLTGREPAQRCSMILGRERCSVPSSTAACVGRARNLSMCLYKALVHAACAQHNPVLWNPNSSVLWKGGDRMYMCDGPWCHKAGTRSAANPQESLAPLDGKQHWVAFFRVTSVSAART